MKDKLYKIGDTILSIIAGILTILFIYFAFKFVIFIGKSAYKFLITPQPRQVCYYHYIDANGYEGNASICKGYMGNIYCGNKEDVHLITFVEKICENK